MATMGSDTLYSTVLHSSPAEPPVFHPRELGTVNARWGYWQPACIISARKTLDPAAVFSNYHATFLHRLRTLRDLAVPWREIKRLDLDSPLTTQESFLVMVDNIRQQAHSGYKIYKKDSQKGRRKKA